MSDRSLRHHDAVAIGDSELRRHAMVMGTTIAVPNDCVARTGERAG
jgi:hypothetical protein